MMLLYQEEIVSEEELCKRIQIFTRSGLRDYGKFLPQAAGRYQDGRGAEHNTRTGYRLHAIQQMILDGDLDFTRQDRVVYRETKRENRFAREKITTIKK